MEFQLHFVNLREPKLAILKIIENQKVNATLTVHACNVVKNAFIPF